MSGSGETAAPRPAALVFALLAPPAAWALHLGVSYSLTTPVCEADARWVLHLVWVVAIALSVGGGWVAWGAWGRGGREAAGPRRFLLMAAMAWSAFLTLALVAAWLPVLAAGCA